MAKAKDNQEAKLAENRTKIREKTQELMLALLDKTIKDMKKKEEGGEAPDTVRGLGVIDKAIKFLAIENKIDEGEWGDGLHEDDEVED